MTGVSGANSCWCCWVRTMFCLYNTTVAGSHHQLNGYCRWNSWWVFFLSCIIQLVEASCEFQISQDPKSFAKRRARHIYTFIWEIVSDWFIWHLRSSFNFLSKNVSSSWYTTRHMGPFEHLQRGNLVRNPRHYLTWETGETGDHNCNAQWLQVGSALATLRRSPAVPMYVFMSGRILWPKSIGIQGKRTAWPSEAARVCARSMWESELIFSFVWIFLTGLRQLMNEECYYHHLHNMVCIAKSPTFALSGAHQLTITARTGRLLHLQFFYVL